MPSATGHCSASSSGSRPRLEVAEVFRAHGARYRQTHYLTAEQRKAMWAIENCRSSVLGGHVDVCHECGHATPSYNSCRNRHCPKCQGLSQARWIAARKARVLPTAHFHVVFTLPAALRPLAIVNKRVVFGLLFKAAAETLQEFAADPKRLGAQLAITTVLHTWSRTLAFHPHVHCIVTGGGLSKDGKSWIRAKSDGKFLFPIKPLSIVFRGKFLDGLDRARNDGQLQFIGQSASLVRPAAFKRFKASLYSSDWVVYAKRPFGGAEHVFEYLGRYTHRTGISNHRLVSLDRRRGVTFRTRGDHTVTLRSEEFIRRFLQHVLPSGFVKIRHYGLLAPANINTRLAAARAILEREGHAASAPEAPADPDPLPLDWRDLLRGLTGIDAARCSKCGIGTLVRYPFLAALLLARAPPPSTTTTA